MAAREREHVVEELREEVEEKVPLVIETPIAQVPQSQRVAKERQKPLFAELADTKLPQVDLLDGVQARQETVTPESLEMTSRLIEKKLKDFGVEALQPVRQVGVARRLGQDQAVAPVVGGIRGRAQHDAIVTLDDLGAEAAGQQMRLPAQAKLVDPAPAAYQPTAAPSRRGSLAAT